MEELKRLLLKDIEERDQIRMGLKRVRQRQTTLTVLGIFILIMFSLNVIQTSIQIRKENEIIKNLNDVIHAGRLLIESYEQADSLNTDVDYLPKK